MRPRKPLRWCFVTLPDFATGESMTWPAWLRSHVGRWSGLHRDWPGPYRSERCGSGEYPQGAVSSSIPAERGIKRRLQPMPLDHGAASFETCAPLLQMLGFSGLSVSARLPVP
jgi:hypothetical protein